MVKTATGTPYLTPLKVGDYLTITVDAKDLTVEEGVDVTGKLPYGSTLLPGNVLNITYAFNAKVVEPGVGGFKIISDKGLPLYTSGEKGVVYIDPKYHNKPVIEGKPEYGVQYKTWGGAPRKRRSTKRNKRTKRRSHKHRK